MTQGCVSVTRYRGERWTSTHIVTSFLMSLQNGAIWLFQSHLSMIWFMLHFPSLCPWSTGAVYNSNWTGPCSYSGLVNTPRQFHVKIYSTVNPCRMTHTSQYAFIKKIIIQVALSIKCNVKGCLSHLV